MSQNNRAFRSNPNKISVTKEPFEPRSHKITEPSAQIPTKTNMGRQLDLIGHKITEPSAQIPTFLKTKAFGISHGECHKITEPSAQIPTIINAIIVPKSNTKWCHKITEPSAQIPTPKTICLFAGFCKFVTK